MRVVRVAEDAPDRAVLAEAAAMLRAGRLVAFPTETVYGLGAHALDERAVQRIYDAKGRPERNPLIVHVAAAAAARELTVDWTLAADALARAFWPGPLTVVVRKRDIIPDIVTAGRDTVGLRVPAHRVALELLRVAAIPVAAPSANLSTQVSPTTAQHVARGLGDRVDLVLDGGPTVVGIESTVVDVTGDTPRLLRPGMISLDMIKRVVGRAEFARDTASDAAALSPGTSGRHYAPRANVRLFGTSDRDAAVAEARAAVARGDRVATMVFQPLGLESASEHEMPRDADAYARALYAILHAIDDARSDVVFIERPPDTAEWFAIRDRLERSTR